MDIERDILPSRCYRSSGLAVDGVVVHYFSAIYVEPHRWDDLRVCRQLLVDLNHSKQERKKYLTDSGPDSRMYASYHYLVGRDGRILILVPLSQQAYHAGRSEMYGVENCNQWTAGVSFVATHESGFTEEQYKSGAKICATLAESFGFEKKYIKGHDYVAPERKKDPGPEFDWDRFYSDIGKRLES